MWSVKPVEPDQHIHKINLFEGESPLSYEVVINYWL